jgi:hypothetical protein
MARELSAKNTKRRLRHNANTSEERANRDLKILEETGRMKPVAEWDYEELQLGKPRTKGEGFDGPAPKWITGQVREEIRRRLAQGVRADMAQHAQPAVAVMVELAKNKNEDSRVRADAAKFIIDHLAGKATVSLEVDSTDRLHQFLAGALVLPGGQPAHPS